MQKQFVRTLLLVLVLLDAALVQVVAQQPDPVQHEFIIQNFPTESGIVLPEARIVYDTYGKLNTAADNAVLLPSHFMPNLNGYEWLIGPGKALDPDKLFLITTELFGNGRPLSPSNTPEPFKDPRFPAVTIRDNVNATHRLGHFHGE
jgi:homoserine O-acetyltransferase